MLTMLAALGGTGPACAALSTPGAGERQASAAGRSAGQGTEPERGGPAAAAPAKAAPKGFEQILSLDTLHVIEISADPKLLPFLDTDRSVKVPCDVTIDGEKFKDANFSEKGDIGSSSTLAEKPGFNIRFGKDRPNGMKKLTINNARQDVTFLHEHIAYELYRRAGLPSPRTAHGVMTLNGHPYGLYVMVEPKDTLFLARHFGKDNDKGHLYEVDIVDFVDAADDPVHISLKDEDDDPSKADLTKRADLRELASLIHAPDDQLVSAVAERMDLAGFVTAYALDALIGHWDGPMFNTNNYYLYNNPATRRFVLLVHGIDQGFDLAFDPLQAPKMLLAQRVRGIPALDAQWRAEMNRVMEQAWVVPDLLARIDRVLSIATNVKASGEAVQRDLDLLHTFGPGMRDMVDARRAQWLQQRF